MRSWLGIKDPVKDGIFPNYVKDYIVESGYANQECFVELDADIKETRSVVKINDLTDTEVEKKFVHACVVCREPVDHPWTLRGADQICTAHLHRRRNIWRAHQRRKKLF